MCVRRSLRRDRSGPGHPSGLQARTTASYDRDFAGDSSSFSTEMRGSSATIGSIIGRAEGDGCDRRHRVRAGRVGVYDLTEIG